MMEMSENETYDFLVFDALVSESSVAAEFVFSHISSLFLVIPMSNWYFALEINDIYTLLKAFSGARSEMHIRFLVATVKRVINCTHSAFSDCYNMNNTLCSINAVDKTKIITQQNKLETVLFNLVCSSVHLFPSGLLAGIYYFFDWRHQVPAFQRCAWDLHLQTLQCHPGLCVSIGPGLGVTQQGHWGLGDDISSWWWISLGHCDDVSGMKAAGSRVPSLLCAQERKNPSYCCFCPLKNSVVRFFCCENRQKKHFPHRSWLSSPLIKSPSAKGHHPCGNRSEKFKLRPIGRAKPETKLLFLSENLLLIFTDPHSLAVTLK